MLNSEQEQYKLIARARLVAAGVCHWSQHCELEQVRLGLQLLAEKLARLNEPEIELQIRESLRRPGLHVLELPSLEGSSPT